MIVKRIITGELEENCFIIEINDECIIVDPGDDYEKIKEKYGVNVLVDMIDEMILNDKYKETTKEEKEYIKEKVKEVEDSAKQYNTTFEYLIAYYYGLESKTEFEKFVSLSYRRNEAVKELVKKV